MSSLPLTVAERRANFVDNGQCALHVAILDGMISSAAQAGDDIFPPQWSGRDVAEDMTRAARMSELFTATPEMFDLIKHAAHTLPPQTLEEFDLPSPYGWLHLPVPLTITDARLDDYRVTDVMWGQRVIGHEGVSPGRGLPAVNQGIVLWIFVAADDIREDLSSRVRGDRAAWQKLHTELPDASLFYLQTVAFGTQSWDILSNEKGQRPEKSSHDGEVIARQDDGTVTLLTSSGDTVTAVPNQIVQFLKSYFHFISSELTTREREPLPKSANRWLRRLELPSGPVTVVRLRRRSARLTRSQSGNYELDYRYVRRGHWRKQWYGSGEEKYQRHIWIAPTVVGPEDAPLRVREVVNIVVR